MRKLLFLSIMLVLLAACNNPQEQGTANTEELKELTVVLDWTPNTNHTGLYVARDKGYFEDAGLDVEIIMPGEASAEQLVASGKAEFGISYQEGITEARIQDVPIVSLAAIIQHNTSGFASLEESNITAAKDFEGKSYGGFGAPVEQAIMESIMNQDNADVEQVDIVNIGDADFFTSMEQGIDFAWIYYAWTGVEAELRNQPINMIYLTDYSEKLDYYTPVLATNEAMIEDEPETVNQFMNAVSKGYEFAIDNPESAAEILIDAVPDLDPELVKASQEWLSPRYQDDAEQWGVQKQVVWENYAEWMYENNLLEDKLDSERAFTNKFLPKMGDE
ncbi:ABC transporter substrate-binding protein [Oceanobacillus massiliensis]|uniref:ABC transporter substrate-binding protein n=1 Tax=Oceanobacillus massiliensis TaxID=1465765 RepID=UPI00301B60C2